MYLAQFLEKTHRIFYNLGQFWKTLEQNNLATTNNQQVTINNNNVNNNNYYY